jgi:hypothetical protein
MALWATKHSQGRLSSARQWRALAGRRLWIAALLVLAGAALLPAQAGATHVPGLMVRDTSGPPISAAPGADGPAQTAPPRGLVPSQPGDVQRQGNVVALFDDPTDPLIVLAVENGYLTVRLRCGPLCPSIRIGDYVVAEGSRRSEAVLDARDVWVVTP